MHVDSVVCVSFQCLKKFQGRLLLLCTAGCLLCTCSCLPLGHVVVPELACVELTLSYAYVLAC